MKFFVITCMFLICFPLHAQSWKVHDTENFRIFHQYSQDYVKRVGDYAEEQRTGIIKKWFGDSKGEFQRGRFELHLHPLNIDSKITTKPWMVGATTRNGDLVRIDVKMDAAFLWECVLPHEISHAVIGSYFGFSLPRWVDEGMAGQSESEERLTGLKISLSTKEPYSLSELADLKDYPTSPQKIEVYYAQSITLVKSLVDLKGEETFIQFVFDMRKTNFQKSFHKHYQIISLEGLK